MLLLDWSLRRFIVHRLLKRTRFDASLQYAIGKIAGYIFVTLGFFIALEVNGVNLSSLAVIAGAIGVGDIDDMKEKTMRRTTKNQIFVLRQLISTCFDHHYPSQILIS